MIIDIHSHIGDILNINGGELIHKHGVKKDTEYRALDAYEEKLFRMSEMEDYDYGGIDLLDEGAMAAMDRNLTATLENMRESMDEAGISKTVCLPIPPNLTFNNLKAAQQIDPDIIPFTGIDFSSENDFDAALKEDVSQGAKGIKLHPIIQKTPLNSKKTFEAVEAFAQYNLPILFHCGVSSYYLGEEKEKNQIMEYGRIQDAEELVAAFPQVSFIAGHAGMLEVKKAIELLSKYNNVYVDTSFQAPEIIVELLSAFGPERVLYASDWPFGNRVVSVKTVKEACRGDKKLEKMIFYQNAARLLNIDE